MFAVSSPLLTYEKSTVQVGVLSKYLIEASGLYGVVTPQPEPGPHVTTMGGFTARSTGWLNS
ncbi:hypothetical protein CI238_12921 [Colletotrichum incanum]|uniref:Uncharacterized protein n=1 Tax=Colletotrichum incanum TaxID=1573173 RepID=A0A167BV43_COLIC|nr:hypothetical protein CI238_12921 [Colletotrichum incanum]